MHCQPEHIRAIQDDKLRAAARYRVAAQVPARSSKRRKLNILAVAGLTACLGVSLSLSTGGALAASATSPVPAGARVAGQGYPYYLARYWQNELDSPPPVRPCQTLTVGGGRVALLTLATLTPGIDRYTCSVSAHMPLYVAQLSAECSTFKGDHNGYGTSDADLRRCARAALQGGRERTTLDGDAVAVSKLMTASPVYRLHLSRKNIFGATQRRGRSAAYGYGLLLRSLSRGTHRIHVAASIDSAKFDIAWTVHAH